MKGNLFDSPTAAGMYRNALHSLYNGQVMPFEREILSMAPLPADIVDPFASEEADPLQIMGMTYNSLTVWIEEAKKANYFSIHFTNLSKLVLKGVMTMGRGLMSLHNRGEELDRAPMSIGELIGVASYHFRKSYLGVIQTASSHPEISERLLLNQLSWMNMLLRLYKTRDKLALPVTGGQLPAGEAPALPQNEGAALPFGADDGIPALDAEVSALDEGSAGFAAQSSLHEPGAFGAPHALGGLEKSSRCRAAGGGKKPEKSGSAAVPAPDQMGEAHTSQCGHPDEASAPDPNQAQPEPSEGEAPAQDPNQAQPEPSEGKAPAPDPDQAQPEPSGDEAPSPVQAGEAHTSQSGHPDEAPDSPYDSETGPGSYLDILQRVYARSEASENGSLTFTEEEMRLLSEDPDFNSIYPEAGADIRLILSQIDSG